MSTSEASICSLFIIADIYLFERIFKWYCIDRVGSGIQNNQNRYFVRWQIFKYSYIKGIDPVFFPRTPIGAWADEFVCDRVTDWWIPHMMFLLIEYVLFWLRSDVSRMRQHWKSALHPFGTMSPCPIHPYIIYTIDAYSGSIPNLSNVTRVYEAHIACIRNKRTFDCFLQKRSFESPLSFWICACIFSYHKQVVLLSTFIKLSLDFALCHWTIFANFQMQLDTNEFMWIKSKSFALISGSGTQIEYENAHTDFWDEMRFMYAAT